jgi:signal transduction histidine kinase
MLSALTLVGIFTEIFASGILLAGIYSFLKKFLEQKQIKDLILSLIFLGLAVYTITTIFSQIYYNLGGSPATLITAQKILHINFLIMSLLILALLRARLNLRITWLIILLAAPLAFYLYVIALLPSHQITLNFRPDVVEPVVTLGKLPLLAKPIWAASWALLGIFCLISALRERGGRRMLTLMTGSAAVLFILAYLCANLYPYSEQSLYLIVSWAINLVAILALTLGELIPPDSKLASYPLSFLRTRVLFKLLFIFVLLIVILFEITTLATITLSKQALHNSIINNYQEIAAGVADKISDMPGLSSAKLKELIAQKTVKDRYIYVIDKEGTIIAHPDKTRVKARQNLRHLKFIQQLLSGKAGGGEFPPDEYGEEKVGAFAPIEKFGGGVVVEEPIREAYGKMRELETNSLLLTIVGILLTVFSGIFFVRSIERPIHQLTLGTEAVSKGDLNYRISVDSADEIGVLAIAFNKMTKDLKESQERLILSEKLASLGTMAAGMAHEIKNPLVSLRTFSQLLQQKWEDAEFREKFSQIVPNEIERINKIAESLLKFGRPVKPELTRVNINSVLEEILTLFESECKKNGIQVTMKLAELPEIMGDSQQLSQAFVNIILNAIQAMEEAKGGEMIIKTDVGEVVKLGRPTRTGVEKERGEMVWEAAEESPQPIPAVFVEISDSGPGIEPDKIRSLFDPFYTTKIKGTGMGLPITLRIIEEHKGSIKVKSQLGRGTSFIITLPQRMDQI